MAAMAVAPVYAPAYAQDGEEAVPADGTAGDEVVVRGIRRSIESAQDIKREADTFVDAITAEDIGALSDRSIAEALQRVPGVSVSNFSGPNDPDHFSVEGSGVVIRGLTLTRSELNGRDIFSTGIGRSIDFQDFPSELVSAIEVFKNSSADQIEGGLAGTVNLKTRKPFDSNGRVIAGSVDFNHSDLQELQTFTPGGSLLLTDRWDTNIGEFGLLFSGSFSRLVNESNGSQIGVSQNFFAPGNNGAFDGVVAQVEQDIFGGAFPNRLPGDQFSIVGAGIRSEERERERYGFDAAAQWRSPDKRTTATFEFFRTDATLSWSENVIEPQVDAFAIQSNTGGSGGTGIPIDAAGAVLGIDNVSAFLEPVLGVTNGISSARQVPLGGTFLDVDESGQFQAGVLTSAASGWRGIAPVAPGSCPGFFCDGFAGTVSTQLIQPSPFLSTNRGRDEQSDTSNFTFNLRHEATDRFRFELDAQYIRANNQIFDGSANFAFFANTFLDLNDGGIPDIQFLPGANEQTGQANVLPDADGNLTDEQVAAINSAFTDPNNFFFRSTLNFFEDSDTEELAFEGNAEYDLDNGFITTVKTGFRFSDRDQNAQATNFVFGFVNEIFNGDIPLSIADIAALADDPDSAAFGVENLVETFNFDGFQRGQVPSPGSFLFAGDFFRSNGAVPGSPLGAVLDELQLAFPGLTNVGNGDLVANPLNERNFDDNLVDDLIPGTPFRVGEISRTSESTLAAYLLFKYQTGPIEGNFGLRWVRTNVSSLGNVTTAGITPVTQADIDAGFAEPDAVIGTPLGCQDIVNIPPDVPVSSNTDIGQQSSLCQLPIDQQIAVATFFGPTSSSTPQVTTNIENLFLPSFNFKYDLGGGALLRFAASRTIFRPNFSLFRSNLFISQDDDPADGSFRIRSDGGNPFLNPISAINLDGSFEWYFNESGSVTISGFWKSLSDVIQQGESAGGPITLNGVTLSPEVIGPANAATGSLRGAELAYRQFYDFLPGALGNIGFEGSYTFVDQSSIPNAGIQENLGTDGFFAGPSAAAFAISDLEGLSRHTINAAGIYESDLISFRLAYNWRSRFLLTVRDVINPNLPVFNAPQGSLDGSVFINITDNVKLGVQAVNLLNRTIRTEQQINDVGGLAPRSFFTNDRRFSVGVRFNF